MTMNNLKRGLYSVILFLFIQSVYASETYQINTGEFTKLNISDGFKVKIVQGEVSDLKITIDPEYKKYLSVKVSKSGELKLSMKIPGHINRKLHSGMNPQYSAVITMPKLEAIKLSQAASLESDGAFVVDKFIGHFNDASSVNGLELRGTDEDSDVELIVSTVSSVKMNINVHECLLKMKGSTKAILEGDFNYLETRLSDVAQLDIAGKAKIARYTSSDCSVINASNLIAKEVFLKTKKVPTVSFYVSDNIAEFNNSKVSRITIYSPEKINAGIK